MLLNHPRLGKLLLSLLSQVQLSQANNTAQCLGVLESDCMSVNPQLSCPFDPLFLIYKTGVITVPTPQEGFPGGAMVKNPPAKAEDARDMGSIPGWEEEIATHSSILASKIPWTEEPGGLQSMGSIKSQKWRKRRKKKSQKCLSTQHTPQELNEILLIKRKRHNVPHIMCSIHNPYYFSYHYHHSQT